MTKEKTRLIRTVCPAHCGIDACGILAHVKGDRVVKVEPAGFPNPKLRRICLRGLSSLDITYHPERLQYPMRRVGERGAGKFDLPFSTPSGKIELYAESLVDDGQALPVFLEPLGNTAKNRE